MIRTNYVVAKSPQAERNRSIRATSKGAIYIATRRPFADDHQAEVAFEVSHREVSAIPSYRSVSTLDAPRNTHVQLSR
jgi:hypothetical protein